jgi:endonuclease/exonuclease/phosphatase family metal-dependent hydrolase
MIKKFLWVLPIIFLIILGLSAMTVFYAAGPVIPENKLPSYGLLKYHDIQTSSHLSSSLHFVTYNIGYASGQKNNKGSILTPKEVKENLDAMVEELKKTPPDILALQEVDFKAARTFGINELDYLAHGLDMPYAAYAITWNKRYVAWPYWPISLHFGSVVSGQAILSRYPLSDYEVHYRGKPARNPFWYNLFYLDRVVQKVHVSLGEKEFTVWNVHLEAFDPVTRREQVHRLADEVKQQGGLKFVLGDFNSSITMRDDVSAEDKEMESSEAILSFMELTDMLNAGTKPFYTFPSWDPARKLDHIVYSPSVRNLEARTLPSLRASDHLPVLADFVLSH